MATGTTLKQLREAAMDNLGLLLQAAATVVSGTAVTVPKLLDALPDADRVRDSYLTKDGAVYRRIESGPTAAGVVTLTSALGGLVTDDAIGIYFLLPPDEANSALNEELRTLSYEHRESIALLDNTNEYVLPTWVNTRHQILGVLFRFSESGTLISESAGPAWTPQETGNVVTIRLIALPVALTNLTMIVRLKRLYDPLASDAATTNCPYPLAVRAAEVAIIRKLVKRFGRDKVKMLFGQELAIAEREYQRLKYEETPHAVVTDLYQDWDWDGPDVPLGFENPSW